MVEKGKQIRAGVFPPPPFRAMPERKHFILQELLSNSIHQICHTTNILYTSIPPSPHWHTYQTKHLVELHSIQTNIRSIYFKSYFCVVGHGRFSECRSTQGCDDSESCAEDFTRYLASQFYCAVPDPRTVVMSTYTRPINL